MASAYPLGLAAIAPTLRADYGLSLAGLGIMLSAPTLGMVCTMFAWGRAADRFGERVVMTVGLAGATAALAVVPFLSGWWPVLVALTIAGGSVSGVNAASGRAVMVWFPSDQRGLAMALRQCGLPLGGAFAAAVLPTLAAYGGSPSAFWALGGFTALAAATASAFVREPHRTAVSRPDPAPGASPAGNRYPQLLYLCAVAVLLMLPQIAITGFGIELLRAYSDVSPQRAAVVLIWVNVGGAALRLLVGVWADRTGSRLWPMLMMAIGMAGAFNGLALVLAAGGGPFVEILIVLAGALAMSWNGLAFVAAGELAPPGRAGTYLGLENTAIWSTAAVGALVIGVLADHFEWTLVIGVLMLPALIAAVMLAAVKEPGGRPRAIEPDRSTGVSTSSGGRRSA